MARIARLGVMIDSAGAKRGADETNRALFSMEKTAERTVAAFRQAAAAIGVSLAGIGFGKLVGDAQSFEKQLALISTVLDDATGSTVVFRAELQQLFRSLPVGSMQELSKGLYDIVSAGIPAGDAMNYLNVAARAAIAGVTSTATAVDVLTTATNAWRLQGLSAQQASDQMFMAVNKGKMTFEELASAMGTIAPIAAGYGISLKDVLGATAQLTLNGLSATEAMTGIRSAITNIINPTGTLAQQFPALAKEFNATKLEAVGFTQFLREFNQAAGGSKEAINALFSDVQGKTAVFSLLADGGAAAAAQVEAVSKASGATNVAFEKLANTSAAAAQLLRNQFAAATTDLATVALPAVNAGMSLLTSMLEYVRANGPALAAIVAGLGSGWATYAIAVRASATWTAILGAAQTVQAFVSLAATVRSAADAMALLSIVGKGAAGAIAAVAAIVAGFAAYKAATAAMAADTKKFNDELARTAKAQGMVLPSTLANSAALGRVTAATATTATTQRDAAIAAKELSDALEKTAFSAGNARRSALENAVALRQFVEPAKSSFAEVQKLIQAQERAAGAAKMQANAVKLGIASTVTYRAEQLTAAQVEELRAKGIRLTVEQLDRLKKANFELIQAQDAANRSSPAAQTESWLSSLRDVIGVVQLIGQAFGEVGRTVAAVGTGAQSIASGLQRASEIKNKSGESVGLRGALSGEAGAAGVVSGLGAAGAIVGGIVQIGTALDLFGGKAKQRAKEIAEATRAFNEGIVAFRSTSFGENSAVFTGLGDATKRYGELLGDLAKKFGSIREAMPTPEFAELVRTLEFTKQRIRDDFIGGLTADLNRLNGREDLNQLAEAQKVKEQRDRDAFKLFNERLLSEEEYNRVLAQSAEIFERTAEKIRAAAEKAAAQQAFERGQFGLDLTQRRQTLNGDSRGAFITGQTIQNNAALAQAQQLVDAGTITAEMFEQLKTLLGDEMVQALKDFDEAARQAKQSVLDDLAVRALVAQGRDAEAEQLRIEIANRKELEGVTDEALRQQILYVQGLEATAREQARIAEEQRKLSEQSADIDRRMLDVLRTLDPEKAAELENKQREIDRAKELAGAANEMIRLRLEELYAMEDAARAQQKLTEELDRQRKAAEALANFTASVDEDLLRATGRSFEADVQRLKDQRDNKLKEAKQVGASQETIDKINAWFDAKYAQLIAGQMGGASSSTPDLSAAAANDRFVQLGEETTAVRSARSISESSALQLVDYAASQLAVQRRILAVLEQRDGGGAGLLGSPSLDAFNRQVGQRTSTSALLLGGTVR